ncbi:MAG: DUF192 domain-containing protein [Caldilineaceae bacterium]|jgi:uncharacterized membrane protein (UPF0127 family)|nr:DUF192 domain-containing protein [Caldilineaceae bacterium]
MVHVENVNRQSHLIAEGKMANNSWTRLRGLIGVHDLPEGQGIVIEPCRGVHCMFMSIPIDVIYVNKQHQVVALDKAMKPWAIGKIYRDSRYVVEVPAGTIERTHTEVGDQLRLTTS